MMDLQLSGNIYDITMNSKTLDDNSEELGNHITQSISQTNRQSARRRPKKTYVCKAIENYPKQGKTRRKCYHGEHLGFLVYAFKKVMRVTVRARYIVELKYIIALALPVAQCF